MTNISPEAGAEEQEIALMDSCAETADSQLAPKVDTGEAVTPGQPEVALPEDIKELWAELGRAGKRQKRTMAEIVATRAKLAERLTEWHQDLAGRGREGGFRPCLKENGISASTAYDLMRRHRVTVNLEKEKCPDRTLPSPLPNQVSKRVARDTRRLVKFLTTPEAQLQYLQELAEALRQAMSVGPQEPEASTLA